jgi:hypothetical protein
MHAHCCDDYGLGGMYENITHCRHFDFSVLLIGYINIAYEYIAKL